MADFSELRDTGTHDLTMTVDGHERHFIFISPPDVPPHTRLPLVFFFHGAGGTARQAVRTYHWDIKAKSEKFYMVYPEGLPFNANEEAGFLRNPRVWRDRPNLARTGIDDTHFFAALLEQIEAHVPVDPKRIYVSGFSNGGGMAFLIGELFSDKVAAIAPLATHCVNEQPQLSRPVSVIYMTGTADPLNPLEGGTVQLPWGNKAAHPPIQDTIDLWARLDGCPKMPTRMHHENGVQFAAYGPGNDQAEIHVYLVDGMGHHWPGTIEPLPAVIAGKSIDPFQATDLIWDFFVNHPMPDKKEKK